MGAFRFILLASMVISLIGAVSDGHQKQGKYTALFGVAGVLYLATFVI